MEYIIVTPEVCIKGGLYKQQTVIPLDCYASGHETPMFQTLHTDVRVGRTSVRVMFRAYRNCFHFFTSDREFKT